MNLQALESLGIFPPHLADGNRTSLLYLVAEFISHPKVYTFSFIVGSIIQKSVKCILSATKYMTLIRYSGLSGIEVL